MCVSLSGTGSAALPLLDPHPISGFRRFSVLLAGVVEVGSFLGPKNKGLTRLKGEDS